MAATDKTFNNQRTLDIVFAVCNILMLLSIIWMLWQDHFREYKVEQREFRRVEVAIAQRQALGQLPTIEEFNQKKKDVEDAVKKRDTEENKKTVADARVKQAELQPHKERAEAKFQEINADVGSIASFLNIALEHRDTALADKYRKELARLNALLDDARATRDDNVSQMKAAQATIDDIEGDVTKKLAEFKKVNDRLDGQVKLALTKRWGIGDWIRTQPVINGFADPLKIHQFTINDIPIDYNFKYVTRFDRCMTCHLGIDRPAHTHENLAALTEDDPAKGKLADAQKLYNARVKVLVGDPENSIPPAITDSVQLRSAIKAIPNPNDVVLELLPQTVLTKSRIKQFAAHPRLDLYVGANSKHPAEKFGCSACHYGQGSGTSFIDASHNPNSMDSRHAWEKERGWEHNHMWDFPMLPARFVEASCIKCHHEVTDLVSSDNRVEARKVFRGFNLIKENGCFGCHEISGYKSGNRVGPDLRLEPSTPLEDLHPKERDRAEKDLDNRPGTMRKVGPSLARITEKTNAGWIEKWLRSPTSFRPDTKMPHYYGLSTNNEDVLPEDQKAFPNAEIASIAYFLMKNSTTYLADVEKLRTDGKQAADESRLVDLLNKGSLSPKEREEFDVIKRQIRLRKEVKLEDRAEGYPGKKESGRLLFTEKGCLACHTHQGTETAQNDEKFKSPGIHSEAVFGPNLSQLSAKFGASKEDQAQARKWLIQWIMNPQVHSPRSRMPVTHLTSEQAADIAVWLMSQPALDLGEDWDRLKVAAPGRKDLDNLARVYLTRMLSKRDMEKFLAGALEKTEFSLIKSDLTKDEQELYPKIKDDGALKFYLGKKAVTRLGCFGCHDIPGMESVKSIGVGLNDWGKKPADRLAFEDIDNFFRQHYYHDGVDSLLDKNGRPHSVLEKEVEVTPGVKKKLRLEPYEEFYAEALMGHHRQREGYLNQKIRDPRSYDFNRDRAWDDRARMPKFHFARARKKDSEKADEFQARIMKNEAEAREAVATFVLGLTAEQVPAKMTNSQMTPDRLAEVKGRQVLDKYNCGGCHLIRPGVYDFKASDEALKALNEAHGNFKPQMDASGEIELPNHINWVGRNPLGTGTLTAYGITPELPKDEPGFLLLRLSEALRYEDKSKSVKNMPAGTRVYVPLADLHPAAKGFKTQAEFDRLFQPVAPFGGAFTELLVSYLLAKDKVKYTADGAGARASLPPSLIGQGERTQSDWLYQFLLNPHEVRRMTILRMPKFNMSQEEARALVDYFAAVTRQTNPGVGLSYPHEPTPSREEGYWTRRTEAYVKYLENTKAKDKEGKTLGVSLYKSRVEAYKPVWEQIRQERGPQIEAALKNVAKDIKDKGEALDAKGKELQGANDAKKPEIEKEINALKSSLEAFLQDEQNLKDMQRGLELVEQEKTFKKSDAFAADAFRLMMSRELCTKCHQIGAIAAGEQTKQGPPLDQVFNRLRGDWIVRWVNRPQRFVPDSLMTPYFKHHELELQYQSLLAGPAQQQMDALRDVLLNYPRISQMPINRVHNPDRAPGK